MRTTITRLCAGALLAAIALTSAPASAADGFDGTWTVNIVTRKGVGICDSGGTLPILVSNGRVESSGQIAVSGQVAESGGISVIVGQGVRRATGSGRLTETGGSGTWRGSMCSGTWTAQKI